MSLEQLNQPDIPVPEAVAKREAYIQFLMANPWERVAFEMRELVDNGFSTPMGGNVSMRLGEGQENIMLVTPAHIDKRLLTREQIIAVDIATGDNDGHNRGLEPTSEAPMHQAIYAARPDVRAIVHAHPRQSVLASGMSGESLQQILDRMKTFIPEFVVNYVNDDGTAAVKVTEKFEPMWSKELADQVADTFVHGADIVIMRNHGPIVVGKTMSAAVEKLQLTEELIAISLRVLELEKQGVCSFNTIPPEILERMVGARRTFEQMVNAGNK